MMNSELYEHNEDFKLEKKRQGKYLFEYAGLRVKHPTT